MGEYVGSVICKSSITAHSWPTGCAWHQRTQLPRRRIHAAEQFWVFVVGDRLVVARHSRAGALTDSVIADEPAHRRHRQVFY
jgi:hypothetical protein